jgi:hypothetical protein
MCPRGDRGSEGSVGRCMEEGDKEKDASSPRMRVAYTLWYLEIKNKRLHYSMRRTAQYHPLVY